MTINQIQEAAAVGAASGSPSSSTESQFSSGCFTAPTSSLPPAATLTIPAIRDEVAAGAESSMDDAWARLRSTPCPTREDWTALILAERQSRMAWLAVEEAGGHRRKSRLAEMMGGGAKPKKKAATKRKSKKTKAVEEAAQSTPEAALPA